MAISTKTPENSENRADPDGFTLKDDEIQHFEMKLNEKNTEENGKMASDLVTPGYVKQMINRFSSGYSNDHINGIAGGNNSGDVKNSDICPFKVPLLHSTRSSIRSERPKPFHYPVLLANRSSIPTKPFFDKSYSRNNSANEHSSPASKAKEPCIDVKSSESGSLHQNAETNNLPVFFNSSESTENCSAGGEHCFTETQNGFSDGKPVPPMKHVNSSDSTITSTLEGFVGVDVKNGMYFLNIMAEKEKVLSEKCVESESWLGQDVPDDASGKIRAAIGKASLLTTKKFQQFAALCHKNMLRSQEDDQFQVTSEDLEGFWDLTMIQVSDVVASFEELQELRSNGWKEKKLQDELQTVSTSSKQETPAKNRDVSTPVRTTARKAAKASDLTAEKLRLRAAMQAGRRQRKTSQNDEEVQIFVAEKS